MRRPSSSHVAFLRAVNVAGHAIVKMNDLRDAFASAGCTRARTFIQSGNVVFEAEEKDALVLFRKIHRKVKDLLGAEPTILFRSLAELERVVRSDPFARFDSPFDYAQGRPPGKLYVTFLSRSPDKKPRFPLASAKEGLEAVAMKNLDVFVISGPKPNGSYGYPNNFIEKELGVPATTRNWSTVRRIVEFAGKEV